MRDLESRLGDRDSVRGRRGRRNWEDVGESGGRHGTGGWEVRGRRENVVV